MSQASALLASLSATVHEHSHPVPDTDASFVIDPYSRLIENANYQKNVIMQRDHNSERFTFEIPRYVDGHDMSLCNRVIVHFDNISDDGNTVNSDVAYMTDLQLNPKNSDTVISSWLITREATQIVGILSFSIQYLCVEDDGTISYEWSTDSFEEIEIRKSKNNGEASVVQYTNVLEQWRSEIFGAGDSVMSNITTEGANQVAAVQNESAIQQAAIELKGSETLATIPEDYTEVYNMASEAVRTKADGIVCEVEGEFITMNDSSDDYIRGLNVYGKTTQITTTGKNKLDIDENFTWTGTHSKDITIPAGTYVVTWAKTICGGDNAPQIRFVSNDKWIQLGSSGGSVAMDMTKDETHIYIYANGSSYDNSEGIKSTIVQLMVSVDGGTYEPYSGGVASPSPEWPQELVSIENPIVEICGKNLARSNRDGVLKSLGVSITQINNSSEIVIDGTTTGATSVTVFRDMYLRAGQYTLAVYGLNVNGESYDRAYMMDGSTNAIVNYVQSGRPQTFTISEPKCVSISIVFAADTSYSNKTVKFQLEEGVVATEYEPYQGQNITLNRSIPGVQVFDGSTHTGVPAAFTIDYTDENGIRWGCDSVDLERGVYVQRINEYSITGNESMYKSGDKWHKDGMFSAYMNMLTPSTNYASDDVGVFHCCLSNKCVANTWEWAQHNGLNNIAARKSIIYVSLADSITGILAEDTDETKLSKFKAYLTTQYTAGDPIAVQYILATPIETPLTAEEIEVYKQLKTNYPVTTFTNNSGAWMKAKYNADTKLYISNSVETGVVNTVEEVLNDTY